MDRNAIKVETGTMNPSEAHKFKNLTTQVVLNKEWMIALKWQKIFKYKIGINKNNYDELL